MLFYLSSGVFYVSRIVNCSWVCVCVGRGILNRVVCIYDWSMSAFCGSNCLIFIPFSLFLSAVQDETCTVLPLEPLDSDTARCNPGDLCSVMTCSSPRRTFFLHALSFECTSKPCITFLNQFSVYFHI